MNKKKLWLIVGSSALAVVLITSIIIIVITFVGKELPSIEDFKKVGISDGFTANVKGKLVEYENKDNELPKDAIAIKWTGSDDKSFENVVKWLKDNGYDKIEHFDAKISTFGDFKMYVSYKTVDGKSFIATAIIKTKDGSTDGVSYKEGDLLLTIAFTN